MSRQLRLTLRNDLREVSRAGAVVRAFLTEHGTAASSVHSADVAVEEILSNVIRHGLAAGAAAEIALTATVEGGGVRLHVVDRGRAFDPVQAPEPRLDAPLDQRRVGGLGLPLLRRLTDSLRYERVGDENHLHVAIGFRRE